MPPGELAPVGVIQARCAGCAKRLFDYVNAIREGRLIIRKRCRHCHTMNELTVEGHLS